MQRLVIPVNESVAAAWQEAGAEQRARIISLFCWFWASLGLQSCTMFAHKGRSWSFDQDQNITDLPNITML